MSINRVNKLNAKTVYIDSDDASFGTFCYNEIGDLFLNSDYGMYGYAWRAFGANFEEFLSNCNEYYIMDKFETNYHAMQGKRMSKNWKEKATILIRYFIEHLKHELQSN